MTASPQRVAIVGAGAVGSWIGGNLPQAGFDVTLIDAWPEHVTAMQTAGLTLTEPGSTRRVPVKALHIGQVQSLYRTPIDVAFICVKLYDTDWATTLIAPYLARSGYVVTLQNGLIEERIASIVGWGRTVGCIGGGLSLAVIGPGHVDRARQSRASAHAVFHVGEVHGRITPRVRSLVAMLEHVDAAQPITNLWGIRWTKLVANCMTSALCGVSGLPMRELFADPAGQKIMTQLAGEAIATGTALGFLIEDVFGLAPAQWVAAAAGDAAARVRASAALQNQTQGLGATASSGTAQDIGKKRRTEVDYMNGYVAARALEVGTQAPTHAAMATLVKNVEAGVVTPGRRAMNCLPDV